MSVTVLHGDCLEILPKLGVVVDAVVCDPPYHLISLHTRAANATANGPFSAAHRRLATGFMGQQWDGGDIAFRPETWATIASVMRPGAFLLAFGGTRTYHRMVCAIEDAGFVIQDTIAWLYGSGFPKRRDMLKPAFEPIVLAYKAGGKRTLQVDECRVGVEIPQALGGLHRGTGFTVGRYTGEHVHDETPKARWPANVCHDGSEEVTEGFPRADMRSRPPGSVVKRESGNDGYGNRSSCYGAESRPAGTVMTTYGADGSAARFFYSSKANAQDRWGSRHPTVKPVELMKWLVPLVTPPGGLVLDPFAGSGTTGIAALATGRECILIEREDNWYADIKERLSFYDGGGKHSGSAKNRSRQSEGHGPLFAEPYDPARDTHDSFFGAIEEIGRRVRSGEEKPPTTGYFGTSWGEK